MADIVFLVRRVFLQNHLGVRTFDDHFKEPFGFFHYRGIKRSVVVRAGEFDEFHGFVTFRYRRPGDAA